MTRALNFNAGPATLPLPALERARDELIDFAGTGMSVMEHSHRGKDYDAVHQEAIQLLRELYGVGPEHDVLFVQGGASQQFAQVPMNLLAPGASADYVVTGAWGEKAFAEAEVTAKLVGAGGVRIAASTGEGAGKEKSYRRVPRAQEIEIDPKAAYVHVTSNETIHGVQFPELPDTRGVPLVVDMSSDFMWKRTDVSRIDMVYAGAQKNLGPSGLVVLLIKKSLVERGRHDIPKIFQYRTVAEANSLYNTPPTFAIYLARNVLAWIKESGGLARIEADNRAKAAMLYRVMDAHPDLFACPVETACRSTMNVVFRLPNEELEARFLEGAKKARMVGLKGHRSVGGVRVSLYNAVSVAWVEALVDYMERFAAGL